MTKHAHPCHHKPSPQPSGCRPHRCRPHGGSDPFRSLAHAWADVASASVEAVCSLNCTIWRLNEELFSGVGRAFGRMRHECGCGHRGHCHGHEHDHGCHGHGHHDHCCHDHHDHHCHEKPAEPAPTDGPKNISDDKAEPKLV